MVLANGNKLLWKSFYRKRNHNEKILLIVACTFLFTNISDVAYGLEIKDYEALITASKNNKPVELFSGEWIIRDNLEPGRYNITTAEGSSGNIMITEGGGASLLVNDILGYNRFGGSEQITVYLFGDETIEITGLDSSPLHQLNPKATLKKFMEEIGLLALTSNLAHILLQLLKGRTTTYLYLIRKATLSLVKFLAKICSVALTKYSLN